MTQFTRRTIVLDTSVLLYDKKSIENFDNCDVVLPMVVLDELDHFKDRTGLLGENARYVNRFLDTIRSQGPLNLGVEIGNGSTITIRLCHPDAPENFPLDPFDSDNRILLEALKIQTENPDASLEVITKDINLRVKCDALGLKAEDYRNDYIDLPEETWTGVVEVAAEDDEIDLLYTKKEIEMNLNLSPHTFVVLKSPNNKSALCAWNAKEKKLYRVPDIDVKVGGAMSISGKNKEQKFALWALFKESIPLVTMTGLAGSGKTFLSLMSGISQVQQGKYERIIITRNVQPVGKDIGFLPGDANDKMMPWMGPITDNLRSHLKDKSTFDLMVVNGLIEIAPMSFIRGRTFTNSFIMLEESQNATIHEIKTVVTRVGEGSKIILLGDTDQIDTPYINKETNGLALVTKKLRESHNTAHIHLPVGIRSTIASEASSIL